MSDREQATAGTTEYEAPESIPLEEPAIEEEIANSDEYMQKGWRDEDE